MKMQPDYRWINENDCKGEPLQIVGFAPVDKILYLKNGEDLLQIQLFGKNLNFMIFNEPESDNWMGKYVKIKQEQIKGKNVRTITNYLIKLA